MSIPAPPEEAGRLLALQRYQILDSPPEPAFDHLVELAADLFDAPIALISFVDRDRDWFKARRGFDLPEIGRDVGFCAFAILSDRVTVVEDAREHPRFAVNPLVTGRPWIRSHAGAPLRTPDGYRVGAICIFDTKARTDLSERRLDRLEMLATIAMDQLEMRRARLDPLVSAAFKAAGVGIAILDEQDRLLEANEKYYELLGGAPGEVVALAAGEAGIDGRSRIRRGDGAHVDLHATVRPLRSGDGRRLKAAVFTDVTRMQRAQARLRQSEKMDTVARLAGGVAHICNNLLMIIGGYSQSLIDQLEPGTPIYSCADEIFRAYERTAALTNHLLAFSRHRFIEPRILDLNAFVTALEGQLHRLAGSEFHISAFLDPPLGRVRADAGQIEQALRHLVLNAAEAMPSGGTITIRTCNVDVSSDYPDEYPDLKAGCYVALSVSDTGQGMDAEAMRHLFEPFFSTKGIGRGTGLPSVYGMVKQGGGDVTVSSEPSGGTTVTLYLPRLEQVSEPAD
jgi:signal transduction histidine kinase